MSDGLAKLRADGWSVAVHNDYRLGGQRMTFWLFTHGNRRWIKGEGATDEFAIAAALEESQRPDVRVGLLDAKLNADRALAAEREAHAASQATIRVHEHTIRSVSTRRDAANERARVAEAERDSARHGATLEKQISQTVEDALHATVSRLRVELGERHAVRLVGPGLEPVDALLTDAEEGWIEALSEAKREALNGPCSANGVVECIIAARIRALAEEG